MGEKAIRRPRLSPPATPRPAPAARPRRTMRPARSRSGLRSATACSGASWPDRPRDAEAPRPRFRTARPRRAYPRSRLGDDRDRGGVVGGAGFSGATRVSLFGAASAASILSSRAARAERSASFAFGAPVSSLATRAASPGISPRAASMSARKSFTCVANCWSAVRLAAATVGRVLRVRRLQRRDALVEFRDAGRPGARLERAHPLVEARDGGALALGFRVQRRVLSLSLRSRVRPAGPRSPRHRPSAPGENSRRRRPARRR